MSKSALTFLAIAAVIVLAVIVMSMNNSSDNSSANTATTTTPNQSDETSTEEVAPATDEAVTVTTVHYTEDGYSPKEVEVSVGSTVTFVNDGTQSMWTASDPHPTHTTFSAFDAKRGYKQGESYSFTFTKAGTYKYHNHLAPNDEGTVVVK